MRAAVLLAALALARGRLRSLGSGDLSDTIEQEGSEDSKASEGVACWCRELEEKLDERSREASSEVNFLTTLRDQKHFENSGLRIEVQKHQHEAVQHQQSLDEGSALASAAAADHASDREFHEDALRSLGKALDVIPEGTGGEVRGALEALNSSFASRLREAREAHQLRAGAHEDALRAKGQMLRLAHEGARAAQDRLQAGEGTVAGANAKLSAYAAQQQADAALRAAAQSLCGTVQDGAQARQQLRQQALIAISQAAVVAAQVWGRPGRWLGRARGPQHRAGVEAGAGADQRGLDDAGRADGHSARGRRGEGRHREGGRQGRERSAGHAAAVQRSSGRWAQVQRGGPDAGVCAGRHGSLRCGPSAAVAMQ